MRMEYILLCRLKIYIICKVKRSTFFFFGLVWLSKRAYYSYKGFLSGGGGGGGREGKGNGPKWLILSPKKSKLKTSY
jgi:hypothetical protein